MEQMEQCLKSISYNKILFQSVPQCSTVFQCSNVPLVKSHFQKHFYKKNQPFYEQKTDHPIINYGHFYVRRYLFRRIWGRYTYRHFLNNIIFRAYWNICCQ